MPPGLIDHEEGMSARGDGNGYLLQMKVHCVGVATGQNETRAYASGRTDGPEDIGRAGPLILGR